MTCMASRTQGRPRRAQKAPPWAKGGTGESNTSEGNPTPRLARQASWSLDEGGKLGLMRPMPFWMAGNVVDEVSSINDGGDCHV